MMMFVVMLSITISFSSCGPDDDDPITPTNNMSFSQIKGMWAMNNNTTSTSITSVVDFVDSKTLVAYGPVTTNKNGWGAGKTTMQVPGHSSYYYLVSNKRTYSYTIDGNTIRSTWSTLTYSNSTLYMDSKNYYKRW